MGHIRSRGCRELLKGHDEFLFEHTPDLKGQDIPQQTEQPLIEIRANGVGGVHRSRNRSEVGL